MKFLFSSFLTFIFLNTNAQVWSLQQCVDYATKNNISIKQADIQARIAALQLKQSQLNKYPTANFNFSNSFSFGRSIDFNTNSYISQASLSQNISVQGGVNIFSFNKNKNTVEANTFNAKAALADVEKTVNDVALSVASYYLQIVASYQQTKIVELQLQQTLSNLNNTRKRVDAGNLPELNALEIEAQYASDSTNYVNANTSYQQSLLALKGVLNLDAATNFEITLPNTNIIHLENLTDLQPNAVYAIALNNQPNIKANKFRISAAQKNINVSKSYMLPSLTGSYSLGSGYIDYISGNSFAKVPYFTQLDNNFSQNLGVGISVPIFNNGSAKINYEQSKLNLQNQKLIEEQIEQKLKLDIYTAYTNCVNALQKFNASKKQVDVAQRAFDFANKRYAVGLLNTLDLITNQNNLLRAKTQNLADEYDYIFKMKLLEFYKGQGLKL